MNDAFSLEAITALSVLNRPLGVLQDGVSESGPPLRKVATGMDGQNFKHLTSIGFPAEMTLGPATAGVAAFNGFNPTPDMSGLRALLIRCTSTAGSAAAWVGADETPLTGVTVAQATDLFTKADHGLATGSRFTLTALTGGTGVAAGNVYYAIAASGSTFKAALTLADALANVPIDVTVDGTAGTITPTPNTSLTFAFLADCGEPGAEQTAAAAAVQAFSPRGIFLVGDFSYNVEADGAAGLEDDLAVFQDNIDDEIVYPACGNHEWDRGADLMALMAAQFPYIDAFGDYPGSPAPNYDVSFKADYGDPDPLLHVFFLDPGINSAGSFVAVSGDGLKEWGNWWDWMMEQIRGVDNPRFRVACVHVPPVTSVGQNGESDNGVHTQVAFLARCGLFDLIICGHTHSTEQIVHHGTTILNVSSCVQTIREAGFALSGATADAALLYSNSEARTVGKIIVTPDGLEWQIHQVGGSVLASGTCLPRAVPFGEFNVGLHGLSKTEGGTNGVAAATFLRFQAGDSAVYHFRNLHPAYNAAPLTGVTAAHATELFTKNDHGLITGQRAHLTAITGGTGLGADNWYYAIRFSVNTFYLAISHANAIAGNNVTFTTDGTDITITPFCGIAVNEGVSINTNRHLKLEVLAAGR